jgi:enoyl-[acyl-carrier protein] reductase/trans-2-enoyl-CoA reductase (NAD+)
MIIEPRMRGFICTTSHPTGCAQNVKIKEYIKSKREINGAKSLGDWSFN